MKAKNFSTEKRNEPMKGDNTQRAEVEAHKNLPKPFQSNLKNSKNLADKSHNHTPAQNSSPVCFAGSDEIREDYRD